MIHAQIFREISASHCCKAIDKYFKKLPLHTVEKNPTLQVANDSYSELGWHFTRTNPELPAISKLPELPASAAPTPRRQYFRPGQPQRMQAFRTTELPTKTPEPPVTGTTGLPARSG